jgi:hypothetical protein
MTASRPVAETFSFKAEKASAAAASALKKIAPLAETLPAGRLFSAIATMSDTSSAAALEFERAALATLRQELAEAEVNLERASALADQLNSVLSDQIPIPLPNFFRKKH